MCGELNKSSTPSPYIEKAITDEANLNVDANVKVKDWDGDLSVSSLSLLELAANNDLDRFKKCVGEGFHKLYAEGPWYIRQNGSRQMVLEQWTPAMIAALYGSLDVLLYIVESYALFGGDINQACGQDGTTALHCAAAGGSKSAVEAVKILCNAGADANVLDVHGKRPADLIVAPHRQEDVKRGLEELLKKGQLADLYGNMDYDIPDDFDDCFLPSSSDEIGLFAAMDGEGAENISSSTLSSGSMGSGMSSLSTPSPSSSPKSPPATVLKVLSDGNEKVKEYPIDPSLPDIKNSIYTTDEFRMYAFKIRPCSRAYSHDWTECPFVHPGENARRRDPRRYHYSCVPCPEFRKGACRRGDTCEYAHGVFECWLHPAQYRTRLCKDGTACNRRVCFFAHTAEELRSLYVSTGSAVPSPRTSAFGDMSVMSPLAPGSPLMMSPYSPAHSVQGTMQGTPPMSPSSSASNSLSGTWAHSAIPTLHLPGASLQASRLRAALIARNASMNDSITSPEFDNQLLSDFQPLSAQSLSTQARLNAAVAASGSGITGPRAGKYRNLGLSLAPTNLEELFSSEGFTSPSFSGHDSSLVPQFETHFQSHPYVQSQPFSPGAPRMQQLQAQQAALEVQLQSPIKASSFSLGSLSRTSMLGGIDVEQHSSREAPSSPALAAARAAFAQRDKRSHSSRDLGAGAIWSEWGSPMGKPEWSIQGDLSKLRKSSSFGFRGSEEPDLSWVQTLVKEGLSDTGLTAVSAEICDDGSANGQREDGEISLMRSRIDKLNLN